MDINIILDLIEEELKEANNIYPLFQTQHEAYGVMREELEEAWDEFKLIKKGILIDYWDLCKNDKDGDKAIRIKVINELLRLLEGDVINCIKELIQLGAMLKKAKMLNDRKDDSYNNE
jgi:hypothetical protein